MNTKFKEIQTGLRTIGGFKTDYKVTSNFITLKGLSLSSRWKKDPGSRLYYRNRFLFTFGVNHRTVVGRRTPTLIGHLINLDTEFVRERCQLRSLNDILTPSPPTPFHTSGLKIKTKRRLTGAPKLVKETETKE